MKKFIAVCLVALFGVSALPVIKRAWAASCPAGAVCLSFATFWTTFTYIVTGGTTARGDYNRWIDDWTQVPEAGIDCTGVADSTTSFQTLVNIAAWNKSLHIRIPLGCKISLTSTITATDTSGLII